MVAASRSIVAKDHDRSTDPAVSVDPMSPVGAELDGPGRGLEQSRSATRDRVRRALRPLSRVIPPLRKLLDHRDQLADDIVDLQWTVWQFSEDRRRLVDERMRVNPVVLPREVTADPGSVRGTWMRHHPYSELGAPLFPISLRRRPTTTTLSSGASSTPTTTRSTRITTVTRSGVISLNATLRFTVRSSAATTAQ
jgi:hypothetical protein